MTRANQSYTDEKGRTRWRLNDEIAERLKQLYDILVIGGYAESHARRYSQLAYVISRQAEPIDEMHREARLAEIPGIGETVAGIIGEYVDKGTCAKLEEFAESTPLTVLEPTAIPGLGAQTAKTLYEEHGIDSLAALGKALEEGRLGKIKGIGKKSLDTIRRHIEEHLPS